ncbi:MAG: large repetitive protein, partial [Pseudonocardiales bacterium]|nr:large repetitive protein [Pseudonocardiales bacterium]
AEPSAEFPPCPSSDAFNSVTFNDAGLPPTAVDDTASVVTGHSATLNVVANDDTHGAPDSITAVTQPAHGQVSIVPTVTALAAAASVARPNAVASPTDEVRFTPDAGFIGTTAFTYTLTTPNGSSTATVTVDVLAPPPTAVDDAATTPENQAVTVHVTANDSANGGGALTLNSATDPAHGSVALSGLNVVYTPDQSFVGTDSFTYRISTPFGSTTATVTVTVTAANVLAATGPSATQALDIAFLLLLSGGGVLFAARRRVLPAHR